jgi:Cysteine dioxygenase type I
VLRQLVDDLRDVPPSRRNRLDIARLFQQAGVRWDGGPRLISRRDDYTRTCAYRDDGFEVVLLNWAAGAASEIHDHGGQDCWMLVLSGSLQVDDYVRLDPGNVRGYARVQAEASRVLGAGGLDARAGRYDLHRVSALDGPAVSLHVYSAPLREFLIYDDLARRCETAFGRYDDVISPYATARR